MPVPTNASPIMRCSPPRLSQVPSCLVDWSLLGEETTTTPPVPAYVPKMTPEAAASRSRLRLFEDSLAQLQGSFTGDEAEAGPSICENLSLRLTGTGRDTEAMTQDAPLQLQCSSLPDTVATQVVPDTTPERAAGAVEGIATRELEDDGSGGQRLPGAGFPASSAPIGVGLLKPPSPPQAAGSVHAAPRVPPAVSPCNTPPLTSRGGEAVPVQNAHRGVPTHAPPPPCSPTLPLPQKVALRSQPLRATEEEATMHGGSGRPRGAPPKAAEGGGGAARGTDGPTEGERQRLSAAALKDARREVMGDALAAQQGDALRAVGTFVWSGDDLVVKGLLEGEDPAGGSPGQQQQLMYALHVARKTMGLASFTLERRLSEGALRRRGVGAARGHGARRERRGAASAARRSRTGGWGPQVGGLGGRGRNDGMRVGCAVSSSSAREVSEMSRSVATTGLGGDLAELSDDDDVVSFLGCTAAVESFAGTPSQRQASGARGGGGAAGRSWPDPEVDGTSGATSLRREVKDAGGACGSAPPSGTAPPSSTCAEREGKALPESTHPYPQTANTALHKSKGATEEAIAQQGLAASSGRTSKDASTGAAKRAGVPEGGCGQAIAVPPDDSQLAADIGVSPPAGGSCGQGGLAGEGVGVAQPAQESSRAPEGTSMFRGASAGGAIDGTGSADYPMVAAGTSAAARSGAALRAARGESECAVNAATGARGGDVVAPRVDEEQTVAASAGRRDARIAVGGAHVMGSGSEDVLAEEAGGGGVGGDGACGVPVEVRMAHGDDSGEGAAVVVVEGGVIAGDDGPRDESAHASPQDEETNVLQLQLSLIAESLTQPEGELWKAPEAATSHGRMRGPEVGEGCGGDTGVEAGLGEPQEMAEAGWTLRKDEGAEDCARFPGERPGKGLEHTGGGGVKWPGGILGRGGSAGGSPGQRVGTGEGSAGGSPGQRVGTGEGSEHGGEGWTGVGRQSSVRAEEAVQDEQGSVLEMVLEDFTQDPGQEQEPSQRQDEGTPAGKVSLATSSTTTCGGLTDGGSPIPERPAAVGRAGAGGTADRASAALLEGLAAAAPSSPHAGPAHATRSECEAEQSDLARGSPSTPAPQVPSSTSADERAVLGVISRGHKRKTPPTPAAASPQSKSPGGTPPAKGSPPLPHLPRSPPFARALAKLGLRPAGGPSGGRGAGAQGRTSGRGLSGARRDPHLSLWRAASASEAETSAHGSEEAQGVAGAGAAVWAGGAVQGAPHTGSKPTAEMGGGGCATHAEESGCPDAAPAGEARGQRPLLPADRPQLSSGADASGAALQHSPVQCVDLVSSDSSPERRSPAATSRAVAEALAQVEAVAASPLDARERRGLAWGAKRPLAEGSSEGWTAGGWSANSQGGEEEALGACAPAAGGELPWNLAEGDTGGRGGDGGLQALKGKRPAGLWAAAGTAARSWGARAGAGFTGAAVAGGAGTGGPSSEAANRQVNVERDTSDGRSVAVAAGRAAVPEEALGSAAPAGPRLGPPQLGQWPQGRAQRGPRVPPATQHEWGDSPEDVLPEEEYALSPSAGLPRPLASDSGPCCAPTPAASSAATGEVLQGRHGVVSGSAGSPAGTGGGSVGGVVADPLCSVVPSSQLSARGGGAKGGAGTPSTKAVPGESRDAVEEGACDGSEMEAQVVLPRTSRRRSLAQVMVDTPPEEENEVVEEANEVVGEENEVVEEKNEVVEEEKDDENAADVDAGRAERIVKGGGSAGAGGVLGAQGRGGRGRSRSRRGGRGRGRGSSLAVDSAAVLNEEGTVAAMAAALGMAAAQRAGPEGATGRPVGAAAGASTGRRNPKSTAEVAARGAPRAPAEAGCEWGSSMDTFDFPESQPGPAILPEHQRRTRARAETPDSSPSPLLVAPPGARSLRSQRPRASLFAEAAPGQGLQTGTTRGARGGRGRAGRVGGRGRRGGRRAAPEAEVTITPGLGQSAAPRPRAAIGSAALQGAPRGSTAFAAAAGVGSAPPLGAPQGVDALLAPVAPVSDRSVSPSAPVTSGDPAAGLPGGTSSSPEAVSPAGGKADAAQNAAVPEVAANGARGTNTAAEGVGRAATAGPDTLECAEALEYMSTSPEPYARGGEAAGHGREPAGDAGASGKTVEDIDAERAVKRVRLGCSKCRQAAGGCGVCRNQVAARLLQQGDMPPQEWFCREKSGGKNEAGTDLMQRGKEDARGPGVAGQAAMQAWAAVGVALEEEGRNAGCPQADTTAHAGTEAEDGSNRGKREDAKGGVGDAVGQKRGREDHGDAAGASMDLAKRPASSGRAGTGVAPQSEPQAKGTKERHSAAADRRLGAAGSTRLAAALAAERGRMNTRHRGGSLRRWRLDTRRVTRRVVTRQSDRPFAAGEAAKVQANCGARGRAATAAGERSGRGAHSEGTAREAPRFREAVDREEDGNGADGTTMEIPGAAVAAVGSASEGRMLRRRSCAKMSSEGNAAGDVAGVRALRPRPVAAATAESEAVGDTARGQKRRRGEKVNEAGEETVDLTATPRPPPRRGAALQGEAQPGGAARDAPAAEGGGGRGQTRSSTLFSGLQFLLTGFEDRKAMRRLMARLEEHGGVILQAVPAPESALQGTPGGSGRGVEGDGAGPARRGASVGAWGRGRAAAGYWGKQSRRAGGGAARPGVVVISPASRPPGGLFSGLHIVIVGPAKWVAEFGVILQHAGALVSAISPSEPSRINRQLADLEYFHYVLHCSEEAVPSQLERHARRVRAPCLPHQWAVDCLLTAKIAPPDGTPISPAHAANPTASPPARSSSRRVASAAAPAIQPSTVAGTLPASTRARRQPEPDEPSPEAATRPRRSLAEEPRTQAQVEKRGPPLEGEADEEERSGAATCGDVGEGPVEGSPLGNPSPAELPLNERMPRVAAGHPGAGIGEGACESADVLLAVCPAPVGASTWSQSHARRYHVGFRRQGQEFRVGTPVEIQLSNATTAPPRVGVLEAVYCEMAVEGTGENTAENESGAGDAMARCRWYYQPQHTIFGTTGIFPPKELFSSRHVEENIPVGQIIATCCVRHESATAAPTPPATDCGLAEREEGTRQAYSCKFFYDHTTESLSRAGL
ncbi:hypothetical protein CYMTET_5479 [Cymbomonas tetramitiformis]|uniref:Uncharacterized protein n=1 Tax=Cymbomonas tetramitiformis TaxID=36881 RepID=A0AAE0H0Z6_9CHLO|nr:hypothetical protein CYMTET_5479 [Cymbomonas tetramitiformis]